MGWSGGSTVANEIWKSVGPLLPKEHRRKAARAIFLALSEEDWDTQDESEDLMMAAFGPNWNEEEWV